MRAGGRTIAFLCGVELLALASLVVPLFIGLAIRIPDVTGLTKEVALSAVVVPGAITAMLSNPVSGWLGDRSARRAPIALWGAIAGAVASAGVALAPNLPLLVVAWCAMQAAYNATFATLYGLMAELLTGQQRAIASSWFAAAASGAVVVGMGAALTLPKSVFVLVVLLPLLTVAFTIPAVQHLRDVQPGAIGGVTGQRHRGSLSATLRSAPAAYWWVWSQRLVTQGAYGVIGLYGLYYLQRRTNLGESTSADWVAASSMSASILAVLAAIAVGRMAVRRASLRTLMLTSLALLGVALAIKAVGTVPPAYVAAAVVAGVAIGAYSALDLALVLRAVDGPGAGTLLGFFNIARTLPQSLVPFAAPALLAIGPGDPFGPSSQNYFALNIAGIVLVTLAAVLVVPIGGLLLRDGETADSGGTATSEPVGGV